jgi:hypothetical protein
MQISIIILRSAFIALDSLYVIAASAWWWLNESQAETCSRHAYETKVIYSINSFVYGSYCLILE